MQEAEERECNDLNQEYTQQRHAEAAVVAIASLGPHHAPVPRPIDRPTLFPAHCRFLARASFARIASCTNTASPPARFSKYSVKRGSAVYISARHRCILWLQG